MTTKGTPGRVIRIEDDDWADFEKVCKEKGIARATDIRMYVLREVAAWRKRQTFLASQKQAQSEAILTAKRAALAERKKSAEATPDA